VAKAEIAVCDMPAKIDFSFDSIPSLGPWNYQAATGTRLTVAIPGLSFSIPLVPVAAGAYAVADLEGNIGAFNIQIGADACAELPVVGKTCGSKLTSSLPFYFLGPWTYNFTSACAARPPQGVAFEVTDCGIFDFNGYYKQSEEATTAFTPPLLPVNRTAYDSNLTDKRKSADPSPPPDPKGPVVLVKSAGSEKFNGWYEIFASGGHKHTNRYYKVDNHGLSIQMTKSCWWEMSECTSDHTTGCDKSELVVYYVAYDDCKYKDPWHGLKWANEADNGKNHYRGALPAPTTDYYPTQPKPTPTPPTPPPGSQTIFENVDGAGRGIIRRTEAGTWELMASTLHPAAYSATGGSADMPPQNGWTVQTTGIAPAPKLVILPPPPPRPPSGCDGDPCGKHGSCTAKGQTGYVCSCDKYWEGNNCDKSSIVCCNDDAHHGCLVPNRDRCGHKDCVCDGCHSSQCEQRCGGSVNGCGWSGSCNPTCPPPPPTPPPPKPSECKTCACFYGCKTSGTFSNDQWCPTGYHNCLLGDESVDAKEARRKLSNVTTHPQCCASRQVSTKEECMRSCWTSEHGHTSACKGYPNPCL